VSPPSAMLMKSNFLSFRDTQRIPWPGRLVGHSLLISVDGIQAWLGYLPGILTAPDIQISPVTCGMIALRQREVIARAPLMSSVGSERRLEGRAGDVGIPYFGFRVIPS